MKYEIKTADEWSNAVCALRFDDVETFVEAVDGLMKAVRVETLDEAAVYIEANYTETLITSSIATSIRELADKPADDECE